MEQMLSQCGAYSNGASSSIFGVLLQTLMAAHCALSPPEMWPIDMGPEAVRNGIHNSISYIFKLLA